MDFVVLSLLPLLLHLRFEEEAWDEPRELEEQTDPAAEGARYSAFDAAAKSAPGADGRIGPGAAFVALPLAPATFTFMFPRLVGPVGFCSMYAFVFADAKF